MEDMGMTDTQFKGYVSFLLDEEAGRTCRRPAIFPYTARKGGVAYREKENGAPNGKPAHRENRRAAFRA